MRHTLLIHHDEGSTKRRSRTMTRVAKNCGPHWRRRLGAEWE
jgi:hypothetical protein